MKYTLNAGEWNSVFAIPTSVVDKYIKLAGAGSLKLLLFLMRHGGKEFSEDELREALGFRREGELEDAALFWVQRGIVRADNSRLTAAQDELPEQMTLPEMEAAPQRQSSSLKQVEETSANIYSPVDIAERINNDPAVRYLFKEAQTLYGRLLKQPESRTILMLVDHYGLPAEVAAMLLKYCFKIDKKSTGYIQSVARTWSDDGINTVDAADAVLAKLEHQFAAEQKLREAMQLNGKFTPKQQHFIQIWSDEWGFSIEMIMHAYDITVDNTGSASFSYTNKILENWKNAGIRTKEAAMQDSENFRNSKKKPAENNTSSINVDDVMQDVLNKYLT